MLQLDRAQTPGVAGVVCFTCLSCGKQSQAVLDSKDDVPQRIADPEKAVRPPNSPTCCRMPMEWGGMEQRSIGKISVTMDDWSCSWCKRRLRLPRAEPIEGTDDI